MKERHVKSLIRSVVTHALSLIALTGLAFAGLASGQGTINTLAGNGSTAYSGDGGPAKIASLNHPRGMAVNGTGTVYISDPDNFRIRAVDGSGRIFTVAGNGILQETGDGGLAANASVSDVMGMVVDTSGNLYFGDATNRRIRKIAPGGIISSIAGVGTEGVLRRWRTGNSGAAGTSNGTRLRWREAACLSRTLTNNRIPPH